MHETVPILTLVMLWYLQNSTQNTRISPNPLGAVVIRRMPVEVVYTYCIPSFSAPRNWGTKSCRRLSGYGGYVR